MDKVTQVNIGGQNYGFIAGNVAHGSCNSQAADWIKYLVFTDTIDLLDGVVLSIDFLDSNTAGLGKPVAVYSSNGTDFYYDLAMTDAVTLPPAINYTITHISGTLYSLEEYPVISVNNETFPLCNARGKLCGGSNLWRAGDTVVFLFSNNKFMLLSEAGIDTSAYNDAPLGSYMPYGGTTDPVDKRWLLCDGRDTTGTEIELQTYYPSLYVFLGGTNVLPDLRNRTFMGANPSSQISPASGNLSNVGDVQAAQLPTIVGEFDAQGYTTSAASGGTGAFRRKTTGKIDSGSSDASNYPRVRSFDASFEGASSDHLGANVFTTDGETRPANVRCSWIIKAVSSANTAVLPATDIMQLAQHIDDGISALSAQLSAAMSYRATETRTGGTWIDGKPIFRQVLSGTWTSGTTLDVPFTASNYNIAEFTDIRLRLTDENGSVFTYYQTSSDYENTYYSSADNKFVIRRGSTSPKVPNTYNIIIEYTKTT